MNYPYESIVTNKEVPIFLLMTSVKYVGMHWHDRIELLLVLKGRVRVFVEREEYLLQENDLLLINMNEVHGVEASEENRILLIQIPILYIKKFHKNIEKERFQCESFNYENQESFNMIRSIMAKLMLTTQAKGEGYEIKVQSLTLDLVYNLISKFKIKNHRHSKLKSKKNIERLTRITTYIQQNYMHPLTLNELAEKEQLTVPYLSRYFQQHMGQSFIKYLTDIRLEHAVQLLSKTDWPVIQIAMECGFSNLNTFHKVFKKTFHTTPYQFQKLSKNAGMCKSKKIGIENYNYREEANYNDLYKYLQRSIYHY
ncbi:AraC family transcriptional regulator [Halalkalibacter alkaliphilus]|uniref:AraC family transcriptional regulator n=1 Tax=Halalkalibacter alkaliphilus TaxID=2917993 RepID=A0A9X2I8K3_9BACI|nr:AraC family transcriptional regulator [Halalkalibacter alkaliphilus]MCL7749768.1 AraC family transcriptional regulator [Halalkalibacter alkaliphilus]